MLSLLLTLPLLSAALSLPTTSHWHPHPSTPDKTLYFLNNNPSGASILAIPISLPNHKIAIHATRTSTGGVGAVGLTAPSGNGTAGPDSVYGQHAVVVGGNEFLFAVNPGSNTLAMFSIDPRDPLHPKLVGEPADTMGEFPMSVAYSEKLGTVCVLNGGYNGSVTCFSADPYHGLSSLDTAPRAIFPALNQTNPPSGPANTASDIVFSPSSNFLVATVKGNAGSTPLVHGALTAWAVVDGKVSDTPVVSSFSDMYMQFGFAFAGCDDKLVVSDVSYGGSLLSMDSSLAMTEAAHFALPDFVASCWAVYDAEMDTGYFIDAGKPQMAVIDVSSGTLSGVISVNASLGGLFDSVISGKKLYALTATPEIAVVHLDKKKLGHLVNQIDLSSLGSRTDWQGLAVYPADDYWHKW